MQNRSSHDAWIYLDNNASTRLDSRVLEAMLPFLSGRPGNPSSSHSPGQNAREAVRIARTQVSCLLGAACDEEIVFTSGGTESNNTALLSAIETQTDRNEIVVSTIEHASILAICSRLEKAGRARVIRVGVDSEGRLNQAEFAAALSHRTAIASVQWANNETGVIQPVGALARLAHQAGALFHCDAVQGAGKYAINVSATEIDMLSISAHKLHGPQGVGALYLRKGTPFHALLCGGRQQRARRAGTENVAGIAGFGAAAKLAEESLKNSVAPIAALRDRLESEIAAAIPAVHILGSRAERLPNTSLIAFADMEGDDLVTLLDREGIAVSSGSACATGTMEPSHVVKAMRVPFAYLRGAVRFSLSRETTAAEIACVTEILPALLGELVQPTQWGVAGYVD